MLLGGGVELVVAEDGELAHLFHDLAHVLDGVDDVAITEEGSVLISSGSFRKHIIDYRTYFNDGDPVCGREPIATSAWPHATGPSSRPMSPARC